MTSHSHKHSDSVSYPSPHYIIQITAVQKEVTKHPNRIKYEPGWVISYLEFRVGITSAAEFMLLQNKEESLRVMSTEWPCLTCV